MVRSYLMRRRHRRMVEEAIRNGTYVPPSKTKKQLGKKPIIYDAFLSMDEALEVVAEGKAKGRSVGPVQGDVRWEDILVCLSCRDTQKCELTPPPAGLRLAIEP